MPLTRPERESAARRVDRLAAECSQVLAGRCTLAEALTVYAKLWIHTGATVVALAEPGSREADLETLVEALDGMKADLRASVALAGERAALSKA